MPCLKLPEASLNVQVSMLYPRTRLNASPDFGNRNILHLTRDAVDDDGGGGDDDDYAKTENCKAVKV